MNIPYLIVNSGFNGQKPDRLIYDNINHENAYALNFKKFGHTIFGSYWSLLSHHDADSGYSYFLWIANSIVLGYNLETLYLREFAFAHGSRFTGK